MNKRPSWLQLNWISLAVCAACLLVAIWLMFYRLGDLTAGLSSVELQTAHTSYGWHILSKPLYLPLTVLRSFFFFGAKHHNAYVIRIPNAIFGLLSVTIFGLLIRLWHGNRTALFSIALFGCSAWTLHVSRLASYDVLYLCALPTILLSHSLLQKQSKQPWSIYGVPLLYGLLLFIPGLVWFILLELFFQWRLILEIWQARKELWQKVCFLVSYLFWLPLLIVGLTKASAFRLWLGLPSHFVHTSTLLKNFVGVFVHCFYRGPEYPQLWLGKVPILDAFVLVCCLLGIYFYATHWKAGRSQLLASFFAISVILIAFNGPVGLSIIVPLLFAAAAAGISYILHEWLQVFPLNPVARGFGIGLIVLVVIASCFYNVRSYFVAWPRDETTITAFAPKP